MRRLSTVQQSVACLRLHRLQAVRLIKGATHIAMYMATGMHLAQLSEPRV